MGVHGDQELGRRDLPPEAEIRRLAPDHPAEEEVETLARSAARGQREEMAVAARQAAPREDRPQILGTEGLDEALQRRSHVGSGLSVAREETGPKGAVTEQDALGGQAERSEIPGAIETVPEPVEAGAVLLGVEPQDETVGRWCHAGQRPVDPGTKEVNAAVGQAGGEQGCDLAVGGIRIAEGKLDGVFLDAGGPVEVAGEPLERGP